MRSTGAPLLATLLLLCACGPAAAIYQVWCILHRTTVPNVPLKRALWPAQCCRRCPPPLLPPVAAVRLQAFSPLPSQDQAGQYDWLKQHVGRVSAAVLAGGSQPAVYAASADAGTLAALAPADGRLLWRRVLAEGDAVTRLEVAGQQLVTLSAGGTQLLAWDAHTGAAAWAVDLAPEAAADLAELGRDAVAVSVGSSVKVRAEGAFDAVRAAGGMKGCGWMACGGSRDAPPAPRAATCDATSSEVIGCSTASVIGFKNSFSALYLHLLQAFALDSGKQLWSAAVGGSGAKLFASADGVWAAAADG